jgi:hypothetical protein
METGWKYQDVLRDNKVENKFNNFLSYLITGLRESKKLARELGAVSSEKIQLGYSDCALVYNPYNAMRPPKIMLYAPLILNESSASDPHLIMMAVMANMISDKDPELEALISKKVTEHLVSFEEEKKQRKGITKKS